MNIYIFLKMTERSIMRRFFGSKTSEEEEKLAKWQKEENDILRYNKIIKSLKDSVEYLENERVLCYDKANGLDIERKKWLRKTRLKCSSDEKQRYLSNAKIAFDRRNHRRMVADSYAKRILATERRIQREHINWLNKEELSNVDKLNVDNISNIEDTEDIIDEDIERTINIFENNEIIEDGYTDLNDKDKEISDTLKDGMLSINDDFARLSDEELETELVTSNTDSNILDLPDTPDYEPIPKEKQIKQRVINLV